VERWRRLGEAFDAVLACPPPERAAALAAACNGDERLRNEVEALLDSAPDAEAYLAELAGRVGVPAPGERDPSDAGDLIGSRIGDYSVLRRLGRGGMATVYLVHDPKHDRQVALKLLDATVVASVGSDRFLREIRLAAQLQHPHILPVFDSGDSDGRFWFTMPYIAGGSLRERLKRQGEIPVGDAVRLIRELALALDDAHRHGIVHRDVKPENILLTPEGDPLLADFGIARPLDRGSVVLTGDGALIGTPAYMSPEQSEGSENLDGRSDLYSLGCVLYELLAGEPPFTGPTPRSIMAKRLASPPPDVGVVRDRVPRGLREVLGRVLSRSPSDRYPSGAELAAALGRTIEDPPPESESRGPDRGRRRRLLRGAGLLALPVVALVLAMQAIPGSNAPVSSDRPRLAVLPFQNLGATEDAFFSQGVTDEITSQLAMLPGLRVISRTSADRYRDTRKSLKEIGRELGVSYVLEGTVKWERATGADVGGVRVTPQLIRVSDDTHLWAGHYHLQAPVGLLAAQTTIAMAVAKALGVAITRDRGDPGDAGASSADPQAYADYLKGRHFWQQRTGASLRLAMDYYQRAIERDSGFAPAYAGLAEAGVLLPLFTGTAPAKAWPAARAAAEAGLGLDSTNTQALATLGFGLMSYEWDWDGAEKSFRRAIAHNPNAPTVRQWYSALLGVTDRLDDAVDELRRAAELDPLSSMIGTDLGWIYYALGRDAEAIDQLRQTIQLDSSFAPAHGVLAMAYLHRGERGPALDEAERAVTLSARAAEQLGIWGWVLGSVGRRAEAREVIAELQERARTEFVSPTAIATACLGVGDRDCALRWLARAVDERDALFVLNHHDPVYDAVRSSAEFSALLRRIGL